MHFIMICCIFIDMSCIILILSPPPTSKMSNTLSDEQVDIILKTSLKAQAPPTPSPSRCQVMGVIKSPTGSWWNMGVCVCTCVCWIQVRRWPWLFSGLFNSAYNTIIYTYTHTHHYPIKIGIPYTDIHYISDIKQSNSEIYLLCLR